MHCREKICKMHANAQTGTLCLVTAGFEFLNWSELVATSRWKRMHVHTLTEMWKKIIFIYIYTHTRVNGGGEYNRPKSDKIKGNKFTSTSAAATARERF